MVNLSMCLHGEDVVEYPGSNKNILELLRTHTATATVINIETISHPLFSSIVSLCWSPLGNEETKVFSRVCECGGANHLTTNRVRSEHSSYTYPSV